MSSLLARANLQYNPENEPRVGLGNLPVELLLEIASDLRLEDFTACVQVSRQWHAAWSQPAMAATLCRRFFPISTQDKPHTFVTFQTACRKFFRRRHGKYTSSIDLLWRGAQAPCHFEPDPILHPAGQCLQPKTYRLFVLAYGAGNVVRTDKEQLIFIDNLYTRKRKVLQGATWNFHMSWTFPLMGAADVGDSLLATQVGGPQRGAGCPIFIYHLKTNVGAKHVITDGLEHWLSIRTWGERAFIATRPTTVHVFSHDGASLSLTHAIDPFASMPPEWLAFSPISEKIHPPNRHRTNFLPHPHDPDGVFIVLAGLMPGSKLDKSAHFLVREFSGATHVATYGCDVWETMRLAIEPLFSQWILPAATSSMERWYSDWRGVNDEWSGIYGGSEGVYEVLRFAFKTHSFDGPSQRLTFAWRLHHQFSVTFSTTTKRWEVHRALIDDREDLRLHGPWTPGASMLRNQQLLRIYYHKDARRRTLKPTISAHDINVVVGEERTRTTIGRRNDLYPIQHERMGWSSMPPDSFISLRFSHDEDFTLLWDLAHWDCIVFDFREGVLDLGESESEDDGSEEAEG